MKPHGKRWSRGAFTLMEALIAVAIIGFIGGIGFLALRQNSVAIASKTKLPQDVAMLNRAIQVYRAGGGSLQGITSPNDVLAKLKTTASNGIQIASASGSMVDRRIQAQTGLGTSEQVAIWDYTLGYFRMVNRDDVPSGMTPISEFKLTNSEAKETVGEERSGSFKLAVEDTWVWDFNDQTVSGNSRHVLRPNGTPTSIRSGPVVNPIPLVAPSFTLAPGTYPLSQFPTSIGVLNPNPSGSSRLWASAGAGSWELYGPQYTILPGDTTRAYAESVDPDTYEDSSISSALYLAQKVTLQVGDNLRNSYKYWELGGPLASGSVAPAPIAPGKLLLMNPDDLPDYWESYRSFQMWWTLNGTDPSTGGAGRIGGSTTFENTYPGDEVALGLTDFASAPSLTLKYFAEGKNSNAIISSPVKQKVISRATTQLLPPLITPGNGSLNGTDPVAMVLDLTGGQTPSGARIFYRTDGNDPGVSNGEPLPGAVEYGGTFVPAPNLGPVVSVIARVYPPTGYKSWFVTSPPTTRRYFLPYADKNVFATLGTNREIYVMDPGTGANQLLDATAPFDIRTLALDSENALLYYTEENGGSNWQLGRYDILNNVHTALGGLGSGRAYNSSQQPENLTFFGGSLYCIHRKTDDLIRITVSGNVISTVTKVADISANSTSFDRVGDMVVDENGWMFFSAQDKRYYRYNLISLSGFKRIGDTERDNDALALYQGLLYVGDDGSDYIRRISPGVGSTLSSVKTAPVRRFMDFGSPSATTGSNVSNSLWMVVDAADGPHLHQIRNYRNPLVAADIDYGILYYMDGSTQKQMNDKGDSDINAMCITSTGTMYFVRNFKSSWGGKDRIRPLFKLELASLVVGDPLKATFVGDLNNGLKAMAGTIDPDDMVSGLTISPSGYLTGVLREGSGEGHSSCPNMSGAGEADYLFRFTQPLGGMTGPDLALTRIGQITSATYSSTNTEDVAYAPNGDLYVPDATDDEVYRIDPNTAAILALYSNDSDSDYHALAFDPADYRMIGCSYANANANKLLRVDGGTDNDDTYIDIKSLFNLQGVECMAFFQGPFILINTVPDLYAADGTETIYGVDFDTGTTMPLTDAPFRVRALAMDYRNRRLYYLRNNEFLMTLGSYSLATSTHTTHGSLQDWGWAYRPSEQPDNLAYFGGSLWYIPPRTDDLVRITLNSSGGIASQTRAASITGNTLQFDLVGDLAVAPDGWMYFSAINFEGQRFCRYRLPMLSGFEVLSGPTMPATSASGDPLYQETWFDSLAFRPADASGQRPLLGTFAAAPSPLRTVLTANGTSSFYKPTIPPVNMLDFSDYHPGAMASTTGLATPMLSFSNLQAGYTYADVGGTFLPGVIPAPPPAPSPTLVLVNPNEIPLANQASTVFTVHWSYDGQDPRTSPNKVNGPAFSNGMPAMPVSINLTKWQGRTTLPLQAAAKAVQTTVVEDSQIATASLPIIKTQLRDPQLTDVTDGTGRRTVVITPAIDAGDCPPGCRIYYTTNETDPGVTTDANGLDNPVTGTLYTGPIVVPTSGITDFNVTARVYPPATLAAWFSASVTDYIDVPIGIAGGHLDIDTSHLLYPFRKGTTDGHIHEYDKKYNVVGESFFAFKTSTLKNIPLYVPNGQKFKILVSNADLSPGGRLVINKSYNSADSSTYIPVTTYDNTAISSLPIYSLDGIAGTTRLTQLGLYFNTNVIASGGLIGTVTGAVRANTPGLNGEWRNGALTVQLVKVNPDGTDAFKTNTSISAGGVQGVATTGLLWETTFFWHHKLPAYGL